jgi:hypothetical protein
VPSASEWIVDFGALATIPVHALRGRHISAREGRVDDVTPDGFWVAAESGNCRVFVIPAEGALIHVRVGDLVDLQGEFREASGAETHPRTPFVYAYTVRHAP